MITDNPWNYLFVGLLAAALLLWLLDQSRNSDFMQRHHDTAVKFMMTCALALLAFGIIYTIYGFSTPCPNGCHGNLFYHPISWMPGNIATP